MSGRHHFSSFPPLSLSNIVTKKKHVSSSVLYRPAKLKTKSHVLDLLQELLLSGFGKCLVEENQLGYADADHLNKGIVVHPGAQRHQKLAVHPIHDPTVSGNDGVKILDPVRPLNPGGKEPPERRDDAREYTQRNRVQLYGKDSEVQLEVIVGQLGAADARPDVVEETAVLAELRHAGDETDDARRDQLEHLGGKGLVRREENRLHLAIQRTGEEHGGVHGASHPLELRKEPGEEAADEDRAHPAADETLPRLVGGQLQELPVDELSTKGHAADIRHDIVNNHEQHWISEPKQSIINVVHDVLQLSDRQKEDAQRPAKLVQLELHVVPLQRPNAYQEGRYVHAESGDTGEL